MWGLRNIIIRPYIVVAVGRIYFLPFGIKIKYLAYMKSA